MARQNPSKSKAEAPAEATPATEEAPVTENPTTEVTETPAPAPVDLTPFKTVVTEALAEADKSTGALPVESIAKVNTAYRGIDGNKGKGEARKYLEDSMLEAVGKLDAIAARGYGDLKKNLTAAGGSTSTPKVVDPTAAFVARVAALQLALQIVGTQRPEGEGIDEKIAETVNGSLEQVQAQVNWLASEAEDKGDGPELSPVVRAAFKAASGKGGSGGKGKGGSTNTGPNRSTTKHIEEWAASVAVGTFATHAELAKFKSTEYGDDTPSQGAISARLNSKVVIAGVESVDKGAIDGKNPKGARRVA